MGRRTSMGSATRRLHGPHDPGLDSIFGLPNNGRRQAKLSKIDYFIADQKQDLRRFPDEKDGFWATCASPAVISSFATRRGRWRSAPWSSCQRATSTI